MINLQMAFSSEPRKVGRQVENVRTHKGVPQSVCAARLRQKPIAELTLLCINAECSGWPTLTRMESAFARVLFSAMVITVQLSSHHLASQPDQPISPQHDISFSHEMLKLIANWKCQPEVLIVSPEQQFKTLFYSQHKSRQIR